MSTQTSKVIEVKNLYSIQHGVLHNNGKPCSLIAGDAEQIAFLKKVTQERDEILNGQVMDFDVESTHIASANVKCICGGKVFFEKEVASEDYKNRELVGTIKNCRVCNSQYVIQENEHLELIATLLSKGQKK